MAWERIGSVQVTQDPIIKAASYQDVFNISIGPVCSYKQKSRPTNEICGIINLMHADVATHPMAIKGSKQIVISLKRRFKYFFGNSYPTFTNCIPITSRVND